MEDKKNVSPEQGFYFFKTPTMKLPYGIQPTKQAPDTSTEDKARTEQTAALIDKMTTQFKKDLAHISRFTVTKTNGLDPGLEWQKRSLSEVYVEHGGNLDEIAEAIGATFREDAKVVNGRDFAAQFLNRKPFTRFQLTHKLTNSQAPSSRIQLKTKSQREH